MKLTVAGILLCFFFGSGSPDRKANFSNLCNNFITGYQALHIPDLELSYANNLKHIGSAADIEKEIAFFEKVKSGLAYYENDTLDSQERDDYLLMEYETSLNLERLALEKKWTRKEPAVIPINKFYGIPFDSGWYVYFLKKWIGANVSPDEIYLNGLEEIKKVKNKIEAIREQTGLDSAQFYEHLDDSSFFLTDAAQVQQVFENTKAIVLKNMPNLFYAQDIQDVKIQRGTNEQLAQTPGYYDDNTFYFNYFDAPYNKRQVGWLFIHEAIPGHHYQHAVAANAKRSAVQELFDYPGFSEGWAAYTEELGSALGVYQTPYDELGKWEWDLVRSVRVPLDVGLNYYGWSDEKALAFWKQYIPNQDAIAMREINRMKRWPAQVVTYKYGAAQIMQWKILMQARLGNKFDIRSFHDKVLQHGALPLFMIEQYVFRK